jgi:hypothetical protein
MRDETPVEVQDVNRIRLLDSRPFILHNSHVKSGSRTSKGCPLCKGLLAEDVGVLTFEIPESGIREGNRTDGEEPTPPASGVASWYESINGGVRE